MGCLVTVPTVFGDDASLYIDGVHPGGKLTTENAERLGACVREALKY